MKKIKNMLKGALALAMVACGLQTFAADYYAKCIAKPVPSDGGLVFVSFNALNIPGDNDYKTEDSSSSNHGTFWGKSFTCYGYYKAISGTSDFLYWKDESGNKLDLAVTGRLAYEMSASSTSSSSPTTKTIYAHFHKHTMVYEADDDAKTITYYCTNEDGECVSKPSTTVTLSAPDKTYDRQAYAAKVTGDAAASATIAYYQGETEISAPTDAGSYTVKMTFGDKTVSKGFTIAPAAIDPISLVQNEFYYDGNEKTVTLNPVTANGLTLTEGTEYEVSGNKGTGAATGDTKYTVTVTPANGNFSGTQTADWYVRGHTHQWKFTHSGATLTADCTNTTSECDVPGRTTSIELTATDNGDGVAPTFAIANKDAFLGYVNKFGQLVTIGDTYTVTRLTDDGAAYGKWYVGDYQVECDVTIAGEGVKTLVKEFSIAKPEGGYAKYGWIAGSRDVRYDSWEESLAAASDGDTVYYKGDDRAFETHEFSIGEKNLTLDFGGKTLTYTSGTKTMTLKNTGAGTLTFQNVTILQPRYGLYSYPVASSGNIQFGTGVVVQNTASGSDRYCKITASDGTLTVTNGQYECSFAGTYKLRGGQYKSKYGEPTADTAAGYIVRTISSGDYDRDIVYHEHHIAYEAEGNVISATCDAQDHEFCGYGTKTATLNAPDKDDDGQPYDLAEIVYSDGFPSQTGTISYYSGDTPISAPSTFGKYVAKTTIEGKTAVKAFEVIHHHVFEYDKDDDAGTVTARCTTTPDCDFNKKPRIATLTAQDGTYTGFEQDLASTATNTQDFPTNVVLTYSCGSKPVNVGDYTATMTVADQVTVTKGFSIAQASMGSISASMTSPSLNFTGNEQQNTLGSATLGSYNLTSGDYELSGVTKATGSGYSNETYQVTLTGKGNFTGSQTIEWTIKAPSTEFANDALGRYDLDDYGGNYGEAGARSLTVTDSTKLIFINGAWFAGLTVQPPLTDGWTIGSSFWVGVENLRTSLSTLPGKTYTGTEVSENAVAPWLTLSTKRWGITDYYYVGHVNGIFNITPQMVEDASKDGKESVDFTMMVGGIAWSPDGKSNWDGVKYTDFKLIMPVANAVFAVRAGESVNLPGTVLSAAKIRLGAGASVTNTVQQAKGQIYTEEAGYQVYESEDAGTYTYSCVAKPKVTIPDAEHQTAKVVKVGDTEITGTDNVYTIGYNETVTVTYTLESGYETAEPTKEVKDIKGDMTIEAPTVTATSYAITYVLDGGENDPANPANYTVESDEIALLPATKANYDFTGWTPTNAIPAGSTGAKTFTATWKLAVVEFTVAAPDNASVTKVATNGVAMTTPYKVLPGTAVTVTYKADEGYLFANGSDTMDAEITVSAGGEQPAPQGTETSEAEAKIGTKFYLTLADALTNAADKAVVTVVKDCSVAARIDLDPTKSVTLDADGKTVNVAAGVYAFVYGGATETTGEGTFTVTGEGTFYAPTADSTCFLWARRGNVVVESGSFSMDGDSQCVYADNGCKATINGGTFVNRTGVDVLNVNNDRSAVTDIQCYGGSYSKDPATGDDHLKGSFVAEGYESKLNEETGLYDVTEKTGPVIVPPVGGDPETYPEIKPVEGTNGVYYVEVKTNETTAVEIDGLKETDTVIVPPQIDAVNGTETSPISSEQVKVVANATNGTETVVVDITDAFTIKEEDNGVLIELNSNAVVTVKIEGKQDEEIPVTPVLTDSKDAVKPLVIDETKVATGVKTIPGLKYSLLSGDKVTKIEEVVKTIVAEDTRVVLEAAKTADPAKFYKIQVAK